MSSRLSSPESEDETERLPPEDEQLEALKPPRRYSEAEPNPNLLSPREYFTLEKAEGVEVRMGYGNSDPELNNCGIGCYEPDWIQRFATKRYFMVVFSILSVVQGMSWAYFTATITTLEKRFKISSQTAGIVMTGNEISQVLFSIILSYYGSRGHRPRWIAVGVLFSAMSCFVLASPHIFYGPGNDALSLTEEVGHRFDSSGSFIAEFTQAPFPDPSPDEEGASDTAFNFTPVAPPASESSGSAKRRRVQLCQRNQAVTGDGCGKGDTSIVPLILIFMSQFVAGIGVLLFFSLGGPYLDDNIKKTQSPMLFGITMALRLIGPTLGFLLASVCLKLYISPSMTPIITTEDPRWMGAWWLGWVILGTLMAVTSGFIAMFPRELPKAVERRKQKEQILSPPTLLGARENPSPIDLAIGSQILFTADVAEESPMPKISEMSNAVKALLRNKVNLYNNLSGVFYIFSAIGYWTYMPKYLETIFMQTAVSASAISGVVSILFQAAGLLLSGYLISKFQPSARKLAGWNVFLGFLYVIVKITFTQMGCNTGEIAYGSINPDNSVGAGSWNLTAGCNSDCNCKVNKMLPVCFKEENKVFYSACHAGCTSFSDSTGIGSNCACLPNVESTVTLGSCSEGCYKTFLIFLAVNAVIKFLDSSGRIGNMLVGYRCVDPKEKSLAIGLSIFLISIFAMLPAPILFGAIFDSVCQVWGTKCGGKGNCWLYDADRLRYVFNLTAAGFTFLGAFFDVLVWWYVKDLDLYDEEKNQHTASLKKKSGRNPR